MLQLYDKYSLIQFGSFIVDLAITLISYDNIVLAKVIAEIWEHNDITKNKKKTSAGGRNEQFEHQTSCKQSSNLADYPRHFCFVR